MSRYKIQGGTEFDVPSAREIADLISAEEREHLRGIKFGRLPLLSGTASGSALSIGAGIAQVGPESGYCWVIRRMIVWNMTSGATPDVVNLYFNDAGNSQPVWQFNGNNFGYTWGKGEIIVNGGEIIAFKSVGTFAATGLITVSGSYVQVPAEMLAKVI